MFWPVHSVTRLSLISLLSTSRCIFKDRCVFILGRKMLDYKSERVNIKFLVKMKKSVTENFQLWNSGIYVWFGNQATINAVEVSIISKTKKSTHESLKVQGHVDCFLWYLGYCDGRVGTQWSDGKLAVLHWSLDENAWTCEKETTGIMEKRVDCAPGQCASPQRIDCEAIFS